MALPYFSPSAPRSQLRLTTFSALPGAQPNHVSIPHGAVRRHRQDAQAPHAQLRGGQGAGVAELLEAFDEVGREHERMEADEFNDDATYKAGINQVRVVCG
jgi:hypothetical protein